MKRLFAGFFTVIFSFLLIGELVFLANFSALTSTAFDPTFLKAELRNVGMYPMLQDFINESIEKNINDVAPDLGQAQILQVVRQSITEEFLAQEADNIIDTLSAYLRGEGDVLAIDISTAGFKESMKDSLRQSVTDSPPEGLAGLTPAQLESYLQQAYSGIDLLLPSKITLTAENSAKLQPLRNVFQAVLQVPSLLFMVAGILAVLIVLLNFSARGASRYLGIPLAVAGIIIYGSGSIGMGKVQEQMMGVELPGMMTAEIVSRIARDLMAPAATFGLIIGAAGLVLIVLSFFMPKSASA